MIPINNSNTAWLIVADYNQENDLYYEELREDILDPDVNNWDWEGQNFGVGSFYYAGDVGSVCDLLGGRVGGTIGVDGMGCLGSDKVGSTDSIGGTNNHTYSPTDSLPPIPLVWKIVVVLSAILLIPVILPIVTGIAIIELFELVRQRANHDPD